VDLSHLHFISLVAMFIGGEKLINKSLTDGEIRYLTDNEVYVGVYSDFIKKAKKKRGIIEFLMDYPQKTAIVLVRQKKTYGHWISIFLKVEEPEQGIHVYDSYGNLPDASDWYNNINRSMLKTLGEDQANLSLMLLKANCPIYFNEYQHQKDIDIDGSTITTCGFHAVIRAIFNDLDTNQYNKFITSHGEDPDHFVVSLIQPFL